MTRFSIVHSVADLRRGPDGPRDRQVLMGETGEILQDHGTWVNVRMDKDGYEGSLLTATAGTEVAVTHVIHTRASHAYQDADFKSPDLCALSYGARLAVSGTVGKFAQTAIGFVPLQHLRPIDQPAHDPVTEARKLIGTPYLWGGNSAWGIDCSGLVQGAMIACGIACKGDSGPQSTSLGRDVMGDVYRAGDILFWKGHVGLVSGPDLLLHANAHHMAVVEEPLQAAIARIAENGDGPVTHHRRIEYFWKKEA